MEDRSKRTGVVRPQLDVRCGEQRECDSVLSATNDENDEELNGETDDEETETEYDDGSAQVRNIRDPGQPTANRTSPSTRKPNRSRVTASWRKPVQWDHRTCSGARC